MFLVMGAGGKAQKQEGKSESYHTSLKTEQLTPGCFSLQWHQQCPYLNKDAWS